MSLSAHKIGGPTGAGALIQREGIPANPLSRGGGQERNRRPGTENVAGIVGFGAAALVADPAAFVAHCQPLRDRFESYIKAEIPEAVIIAEAAGRLANTTCLAIPGRIAETQVMALDLTGIAISAGAACSSGKVRASHVLEAMGANDLAACAIRISSGWATVSGDIERLAEALINLYKHS
jgi:cysteine desulfurase